MDLAVVVVRAALALVFVAAAVGKLLDLAGSRKAVQEFGLPRRAAAVVGTLLPVVELAIALALIPTPTARWAGLGALALLLTFVVAIARLIRQGEAPDCHCFGQLHSEPAGPSTLIRNGLLALAAAIVLVAGAGRGMGSLTSEDVAVVVLSVAMLAFAATTTSLWQENRELRKRPAARRRPNADPGLPIGTPAPDLGLTSLEGHPVQLSSFLGGGTPAVLVHISPTCGPCRAMAPNLNRWRATLSGQLNLIAMSSGDLEQNVAFANELGLTEMLIAEPSAFAGAFRARATPSAVMIDDEGLVAARSVSGQMAIESLIRLALRRGNGAAPLDPLAIVQVT